MAKAHNRRGFLICLFMTLSVLCLSVLGKLDTLENKTIDFRFLLRGNRAVDPSIVVITIDEPSIEKLGRWPWKRSTHGKLIRLLGKAGAKVVAFDSLFTESDLQDPASDAELVNAIKEFPNVVSAFFFKSGIQGPIGHDPLFPFSELAEESPLGYVNLDPDSDGITRRAPLVAAEKIEGGQYEIHPSLAVAALTQSRNQGLNDVLSSLPIQMSSNVSDSQNTMLINFAFDKFSQTGYAYPIYSYADVLSEKINLEKTFKDKIIFVGATAAALYDLKAIPFVSIHPGVMVHANIVDNLLHHNYLKESSLLLTLGLITILGLLMGFLLPRVSPWVKSLIFAGTLLLVLGVAQWLFVTKSLVLGLAPLLLVLASSYAGILFYQLVVEEREKRKIKGSFKQYLSPKIIEVITKDPSKLSLGGEEREVSIFFLDIAGFTTMSEALKPTQLVEVMNQCLTVFSEIILKHDGLINKYIGDCIMAFWNAPADQPKHASQACLAALDCINALPELNRKFKEKGLPDIDCRVGINTGVVVVGNMGSNERFDYTVMGDGVNLASRLEGANKQYHSRIMISDVTFEKAKDDIEARDLDLIRVKGKKEPRKVFEVLCKKNEMSEEMRLGRDKYHLGLSLYRQRKFDEAVQTLQEVFDYLPNDHLTRVYLERARAFVINPPPAQWDGVYEMKTK